MFPSSQSSKISCSCWTRYCETHQKPYVAASASEFCFLDGRPRGLFTPSAAAALLFPLPGGRPGLRLGWVESAGDAAWAFAEPGGRPRFLGGPVGALRGALFLILLGDPGGRPRFFGGAFGSFVTSPSALFLLPEPLGRPRGFLGSAALAARSASMTSFGLFLEPKGRPRPVPVVVPSARFFVMPLGRPLGLPAFLAAASPCGSSAGRERACFSK
mmetsp:Transcript_5248/g.15036  ORF Transcript_5248/g.15036 Transcript_5248/m.15036 type:complete len:215 (-) Transcript_5248:430-1074(-)